MGIGYSKLPGSDKDTEEPLEDDEDEQVFGLSYKPTADGEGKLSIYKRTTPATVTTTKTVVPQCLEDEAHQVAHLVNPNCFSIDDEPSTELLTEMAAIQGGTVIGECECMNITCTIQ